MLSTYFQLLNQKIKCVFLPESNSHGTIISCYLFQSAKSHDGQGYDINFISIHWTAKTLVQLMYYFANKHSMCILIRIQSGCGWTNKPKQLDTTVIHSLLRFPDHIVDYSGTDYKSSCCGHPRSEWAPH